MGFATALGTTSGWGLFEFYRQECAGLLGGTPAPNRENIKDLTQHAVLRTHR